MDEHTTLPTESTAPPDAELNEVSLLAIRAQGDPTLMAELWEAVQRLIKLWAYKYAYRATAENGTRILEADDLVQAGYLALVDAVRRYDPNKCAFTTLLWFCTRNHFAKVAGLRGRKNRPELYTLSLDTPISNDGDACFGDMLADPNADFEDDILAQAALRQDCADLLTEIGNLPDKQRQALTLTACDGLTAVAAAKAMGCSDTAVKHHVDNGAAAIRSTATGRRIREDRYPFKHVGVSRFKSTRISAVEWAVLWREERGLLKL